MYNHYISEIRNFRMHLEAHEEHLIRQIRTPLERDDLEQSLRRITEQVVQTLNIKHIMDLIVGFIVIVVFVVLHCRGRLQS